MIDTAALRELVASCFYTEDELAVAEKDKDGVPVDAIIVHGVQLHAGFHPGRIKEAHDQVRHWLMQLPTQFRKSAGGGWSFLNACHDITGEQWGEHRDIDHLMCLGLATGLVATLLPRDTWSSMPGGLPYFMILDDPVQNDPDAGTSPVRPDVHPPGAPPCEDPDDTDASPAAA